MCDQCGPVAPETKAAFEKFEQAIKEFLEETNNSGDILMDWVLISSQTILAEHTDSTMIGWSSRPNQPVHHTKGLLNEALDNMMAANVVNYLNE